MLKVPELNEVTYDQMVQQAVNKIPVMTDQWTDLNYHDPGITVIQTYAWLVDMLNYYMNATGDIHMQKYFKLLGIEPRKPQAATTWLTVQKKTSLDKSKAQENTQTQKMLLAGTPVYAQDICFELSKNASIHSNKFISYISEVDKEAMDLTMFAGNDGDYADLFASEFNDHAAAYFGFAQELSGELTLQICVQENERRNPFSEEFSMSSLKWEYFDGQNWCPLSDITDHTCGFLRNGTLTASLPTPTQPYSHPSIGTKAHYLRCTLEKNTYDELPRIGKIYVNPVFAQQKRTVSRRISLTSNGSMQLAVPCYIPEDASLMVGIVEEDGTAHLIYDEESEFDWGVSLEKGEHAGERTLVFADESLCPKAGMKLDIFVVREEFMTEFSQGMTDGCANQHIYFPYEGVHEIGISTWTEQKDGRHQYKNWSYVPVLDRTDYKAQVFTYDFETKQIIFGDGEHGAIPKQGQQICITELNTSKYAEGNVLENEINRMESGFGSVNVYNPLAATGGFDGDQIEDLKKRLQDEIFTQKRVVSVEDYKNAICSVPGLMIDEVEVLSGKRYGEIHDVNWLDNEVVVAVKPYSKKERPKLDEFYREQIETYIEGLRLINTKVTIVSPSYVGIEVNGRIRLAHKKQGEQEAVLQMLSDMILAPEKETHFGKVLALGKFFSQLEISEAVERVESLSLERLGAGAMKNQKGDIHLYEDALCYISSLNIEFS